LGSDATFAVTDPQGRLTDSGNIDNGGHSLTFDTNSSQSSRLSGSISGVGGFIKSGSGEIVLSGTNSFSGGTQVLAGSLVATATRALPDGTNLTVGAGGTFIFDPSLSASSVSPAGLAVRAPNTAAASGASTPVFMGSASANAQVTTSATSTLLPFLERPGKTLSHVPSAMSSVASDAVFTSHRSAFDQALSPADIAQSARPRAWLAAIESSWNSSDQNKTTDSNVEALDKVLARFGV